MASGFDGARSSASGSLTRLRKALFQCHYALLQPLDTGEPHSGDAADHCRDRHEGHRCLVEEHRPTDEQRGETTKGRDRVPVPLHDPGSLPAMLKILFSLQRSALDGLAGVMSPVQFVDPFPGLQQRVHVR
jgi:hypothetical protein